MATLLACWYLMFVHVILELAEDMKMERKGGDDCCVCNGTTRGIWEHAPTAKVFNQML